MSADPARHLSYALLNPDTAVAAAEALKDHPGRTATEGLIELLHRQHAGRAGVAAVAGLAARDEPLAVDGLLTALASVHASVRLAAVTALHRRGAPGAEAALVHLLNRDDSWPVRRAALAALADQAGAVRWSIMAAATDPHWRVRHALIQVLLHWGAESGSRGAIESHLEAASPAEPSEYTSRRLGVRQFLHFRWFGSVPAGDTALDRSLLALPFSESDPAVLLRNLERMTKAERRAALDALPPLLGHADARIAGMAVDTLREWGEARHMAEALRLFHDPRAGAAAVLHSLVATLDTDRLEETARLLGLPDAESLVAASPRDVVPAPRKSDSHPCARAAALTPARAQALVERPEEETSWHVLATAARLARVSLWKLAPPEPWRPAAVPTPSREPIALGDQPIARPRPLGPERWPVAPLGISGHYGLPAEGFVRAAEVGVNLLFWEPNYHGLSDFMQRLSPAQRGRFHLVAGTFEADGKRLRKDIERALRALGLERLALFLVFWVQSWRRMSPDVREALESARKEGKIAAFGLSTHGRPLAVEAIEAGWDPVMVRHSAAHRGAEREVFPKAMEHGTSILTFSNTCYGRLLQPDAGLPGASAADCYRYALGQPGVTACWSAPATVEELEENLAALRDPDLPDDRREQLLERGAALYREESAFRKWVRTV